MKKTMVIAALVTAVALPVFAGDKAMEKTAKPAQPAADEHVMFPKPGAETKALKPVFVTATWTNGKIHKGAMGPDSPEGTSKGKQTCKWTADDSG